MKWLLTFPEDKPSVPFYRGWLERGGLEHVILLAGDAYPDLSGYDALLLPGGGDVDPARYGDARHAKTNGVDPAQDEREIRLIADFLAAGKPVFGICRGQQILNVALGGRLIQHVPDVVPSETHRVPGGYDASHGLQWAGRSAMCDALKRVGDVNSSHHQAIHPEAVGRSLRVVARSTGGIVEAVESAENGVRISAVQWHPERLPADHPASAGLRAYWKKLAG